VTWPAILGTTALSATVGGAAGFVSQRASARAQARLEYEANARKRLYEAIGPLRFQLLVACRDVERRVTLHTKEPGWNLDPSDYYAKSFIYRILRPLAIGVLVERQMSYADFAVDRAGIELLRFDTASYRMLTGRDPLDYYDGLDFARQAQHVFRDNLRAAASRLLAADGNSKFVVIDFADFADRFPDPRDDTYLAPVARLFPSGYGSLIDQPILWVRLVGYAYACNSYLVRFGTDLGLSRRTVDAKSLIRPVRDDQIRENLALYPGIFDQILAGGL
jgi:hypothetical protein